MKTDGSIVIFGTDQPVEQQIKFDWTIEHGYLVARTQVVTPGNAAAAVGAMQAAGAEKVTRSNTIPVRIEALFPSTVFGGSEDVDAIANALWEADPQTVECDLRNYPQWGTGDLPQLPGQQIALSLLLDEIEAAIASHTPSAGGTWAATFDRDNPGSPHPGAYYGFDDYYALRLRGTNSFQRYTYQITQTLSVSRASAINATLMAGGNTPYSVVAYAQVNVLATAKFGQPYITTWYNGGMQSIALDQWLVLPPKVDYVGHKWKIVNSWLGAVEISGTLYKGGIGP